MALILFALQIYADFSGYSSIARGTAKLLGIELMKNFEQPYLSANITEFWRRWHISLSTWLKDYLYISLGGNRKGKFRTYINLMITMLLGGLWHGASWNFVIWGGLHGVYLSIHKLMLGSKKIPEPFKYNGVSGFLKFSLNLFLTNILVLFTWIFFRSHTLSDSIFFIKRIINWQSSEFSHRIIIITLVFVGMTFLFDVLQYITRKHTFLMLIKNKPIRYGILATLFITVLFYMFQAEPMPFIYFQF